MIEELTYEIALIGACLYGGDCFSKIVDMVSPEDFVDKTCADAFSAMKSTYSNGGDVDPVVISDLMSQLGYDSLAARTFIRDAMMGEGRSSNVEAYAKGVRDKAMLRRISKLLTESLMDYSDPDALANAVMDGICEIERGKKGRARLIKEGLESFVEDVVKTVEDTRVFTGWQRLDRVLGGMGAGNLVVLAGRPGIGKSIMGAEIAIRAAEKGTPTVFMSCEMTEKELVQRYVANRAKIRLDDIIDRSFKNDTMACERFWERHKELLKIPLYIHDEPGITVNDIRRALQTIRGIGLIVVDYVQLMGSAEKSENRNLEVAKISGSLKKLAMEYKIPIVALSQLNRANGEYDEPGLRDLRDSGAIEQDADKAIFLWGLGEAQGDALPLIGVKVAKNRNGKRATVVMRFQGEYMAFYETDEEYKSVRKGKWRKLQPYGGHDPDMTF